MKASYYNVFFPFEGKCLLFNTLQGSIFVVDSETRNLLQKNELSSLDENLTHVFKDNGILVEDNLDEQNMYRMLYERSKYVTPVVDLDLVTTYACNLACIYCYEGKGELETKKMDKKSADCAINFIKNLVEGSNGRKLRMDLFGGEPMLNMPINLTFTQELSKWCEETDRDLSIDVLTNGTLSTEENVEQLAQYDCGFVVVLDGPRDIHDKRRIYKNRKGTFNDIIDGLFRVSDHGLRIRIRINVDETNKDYIVPFFEFLKQEGLTNVILTIKSVFNTSPACTSYTYCMPDVEGLIAVNHFYNIARSMNFATDKPERPVPCGVCSAQKITNFSIDPYLRLFKCSILLPFQKNSVGVINPETTEPEFNYVNVDFMSQNPLLIDECRMCKLVPVCRGGCLAEIFESHSTAHAHVCRKKAIYEVLKENLTNMVQQSK